MSTELFPRIKAHSPLLIAIKNVLSNLNFCIYKRTSVQQDVQVQRYEKSLCSFSFLPQKRETEKARRCGTESIIGKELGIVFNTPEDVIKNIDKLDSFFNSLKTAPELNYFCDTITKKEMYLGIKYIKGDEEHPAINFDYGTKVEVVKCNKMDFAKTLDWKY